MLNSYKGLIVWQKAIELVVEVYRLTNFFPKEEVYGLVSQMRRAAVSIPSNIAEGFVRRHRSERGQFLRISFGSGAELETQVVTAKKLVLCSLNEFQKTEMLLEEIMRMLNRMTQNLSSRSIT